MPGQQLLAQRPYATGLAAMSNALRNRSTTHFAREAALLNACRAVVPAGFSSAKKTSEYDLKLDCASDTSIRRTHSRTKSKDRCIVYYLREGDYETHNMCISDLLEKRPTVQCIDLFHVLWVHLENITIFFHSIDVNLQQLVFRSWLV